MDRVPPYPTDDEREQEAIDHYVFGGIKDDETNLIPSLAAAVRLCKEFALSSHKYEILYCCEGADAIPKDHLGDVSVQHLGYDVATVRGDYWSIAADIPQDAWTVPYRTKLNEHGLFTNRQESEAYLEEYVRTRSPDYDSPFDVVYVTRVLM